MVEVDMLDRFIMRQGHQKRLQRWLTLTFTRRLVLVWDE